MLRCLPTVSLLMPESTAQNVTRGSLRNCSYTCSTCGSSDTHGRHQLAQNASTTSRPRNSSDEIEPPFFGKSEKVTAGTSASRPSEAAIMRGTTPRSTMTVATNTTTATAAAPG